eukprot:gene10694-11832_t
MADWVHCNSCFKQPFEVKIQFNLTNCGHIYCENCLRQASEFCQLCKQKASCIPLSNKMKPEVEKFFVSPREKIKQIMEVMDFQDGHRQRLLQKKMRVDNAPMVETSRNEKMAIAFSELQKELQKFKEENHHLKRAINQMRSQQPEGSPSRMRQSPLQRTPGSQNNYDSKGMQPGRPQLQAAGHTLPKPGQHHQQAMKIDRLSIRTPPVGGVISTPSPCKMYRHSPSNGYPSSQPRGRTIQGSQSSPASQIRSRSITPVHSLQRSLTPISRQQSPCGNSRQVPLPASQKQIDSSSQKPSVATPYSSFSGRASQLESTSLKTPTRTPSNSSSGQHSSPMHLNSSLDPSRRQVRITAHATVKVPTVWISLCLRK